MSDPPEIQDREKHRTGDTDHSTVCAEGLLRTIPESLPGRNGGAAD